MSATYPNSIRRIVRKARTAMGLPCGHGLMRGACLLAVLVLLGAGAPALAQEQATEGPAEERIYSASQRTPRISSLSPKDYTILQPINTGGMQDARRVSSTDSDARQPVAATPTPMVQDDIPADGSAGGGEIAAEEPVDGQLAVATGESAPEKTAPEEITPEEITTDKTTAATPDESASAAMQSEALTETTAPPTASTVGPGTGKTPEQIAREIADSAKTGAAVLDSDGSTSTQAKAPVPAPQKPAPTRTILTAGLAEVDVQATGDAVTVRVQTGGAVKYRRFTLADPVRVIVDVQGYWEYRGRARMDVGQGDVRRVRVGEHPERLRIVVDMAATVQPDAPAATPTIDVTAEGLVIRFGQ